MSLVQNNLSIHVYAPAMVGVDPRPVAVVQGMERALPGLRLDWTVSDEHQLLYLGQRDDWLVTAGRNGGFPLVCNHDEGFPVTVFGVAESARFGPGGQPLLEVHAELPLSPPVIASAADILEGIAEGARAFWGHATPFEAAVEISRQTVDSVLKAGQPPRGLPALKLPEAIRSPAIPHRLGWVNYWSAAAAQTIVSPDFSRDAATIPLARRTATDGWIVQLTDAPLNLDEPTHLDALRRAYERFPQVGGRSSS